MNACQDCLKVYRNELSGQRGTTNILAPSSLKLLPLYALALMKYVSMRKFHGLLTELWNSHRGPNGIKFESFNVVLLVCECQYIKCVLETLKISVRHAYSL